MTLKQATGFDEWRGAREEVLLTVDPFKTKRIDPNLKVSKNAGYPEFPGTPETGSYVDQNTGLLLVPHHNWSDEAQTYIPATAEDNEWGTGSPPTRADHVMIDIYGNPIQSTNQFGNSPMPDYQDDPDDESDSYGDMYGKSRKGKKTKTAWDDIPEYAFSGNEEYTGDEDEDEQLSQDPYAPAVNGDFDDKDVVDFGSGSNIPTPQVAQYIDNHDNTFSMVPVVVANPNISTGYEVHWGLNGPDDVDGPLEFPDLSKGLKGKGRRKSTVEIMTDDFDIFLDSGTGDFEDSDSDIDFYPEGSDGDLITDFIQGSSYGRKGKSVRRSKGSDGPDYYDRMGHGMDWEDDQFDDVDLDDVDSDHTQHYLEVSANPMKYKPADPGPRGYTPTKGRKGRGNRKKFTDGPLLQDDDGNFQEDEGFDPTTAKLRGGSDDITSPNYNPWTDPTQTGDIDLAPDEYEFASFGRKGRRKGIDPETGEEHPDGEWNNWGEGDVDPDQDSVDAWNEEHGDPDAEDQYADSVNMGNLGFPGSTTSPSSGMASPSNQYQGSPFSNFNGAPSTSGWPNGSGLDIDQEDPFEGDDDQSWESQRERNYSYSRRRKGRRPAPNGYSDSTNWQTGAVKFPSTTDDSDFNEFGQHTSNEGREDGRGMSDATKWQVGIGDFPDSTEDYHFNDAGKYSPPGPDEDKESYSYNRSKGKRPTRRSTQQLNFNNKQKGVQQMNKIEALRRQYVGLQKFLKTRNSTILGQAKHMQIRKGIAQANRLLTHPNPAARRKGVQMAAQIVRFSRVNVQKAYRIKALRVRGGTTRRPSR